MSHEPLDHHTSTQTTPATFSSIPRMISAGVDRHCISRPLIGSTRCEPETAHLAGKQ